MKTDVAWLASSLAQTPLEKARILNEFPDGTHRLIARQEKVRRFSCYRRGGEIAGEGRGGGGGGGRRRRRKKEREREVWFIHLEVAVFSHNASSTPNLISFSSCPKMPSLVWAEETKSY